MENKVITFKNGLTVVVAKTSVFKAVRVEIEAKAGPLLETKANSGISHFVEHMALSGSKQFPNIDKFDEEIEILGGGYNGSTDNESINLKIALPDNQLDLGLRFISSAMSEATFPENKLKTEREAILDEIHGYENRRYKKFNEFWKRERYLNGEAPLKIMGTKSYIRSVSRKALIDWYKYILSPDNVTLSIVGNINIDKAIVEAKKYFGNIPMYKKQITRDEWAQYKYSNQKIVTRVDKTDGEAVGIISFPSLSLINDSYKSRQAAVILGNMFANYRSSILFNKLRKERGLLYSVGASTSFEPQTKGLLDIIFTTSDDKMLEVYQIIFNELENIVSKGLTKEQLNIGIQAINNSLKMGYMSLSDIQSWIMPSVFWFKKVRTVDEAIKSRESIDIDYMNKCIKEIIQSNQMAIVSGVKNQKTKRELHKLLEERVPKLNF
ncbi:insulinase family protein [Candidatus Dojkabacteria bacterium]|uniref:Insulinase family protein n=1 Tax=Candidatus Dojkabacteria bacterium TaxID=2099670 RepID=A0A955HZ28_9BACT|nr:insulinase family protein [Candidatus Dojkabacteria bacterium]